MAILCHATRAPGTCGTCRHSNQGTEDFTEGMVACQLGSGGLTVATRCQVDFKPPDRDVPYFMYEPYDGENGTWGSEDTTIEVTVTDDA